VNWLMDLDTALMRLLNVELTHPFLDWFLPLFSDFDVWMIPFIILLIIIVIKDRLKGVLIVAGLGLTILLSETMSTRVVKELVGRIRPCHIHEWVRLVGSYCPNSAAFTSTHAANITAAITFLSFFFPRWLLFVMVPLAIIVGYSRVYKGVHYPLDVIGGAILGIGCGWGIYVLLKKVVFPRIGIEVKPARATLEEGSSTKKRQKGNKR
jgi:undecaprenyl-diphosphatase